MERRPVCDVACEGSVQLRMLRRTAWIWMAGCIAWTIDGLISLRGHALAHAELAFVMALLFGIAWLFYRLPWRR